MKILEAVRVGYGLAMIISPELLLDQERAPTAGAAARRLVRVLGARHVLQGVLLFGRTEKWHRVGAVVDFLHSSSAAVYAVVQPRWRGPAGVSAVVSLGFGLGELR